MPLFKSQSTSSDQAARDRAASQSPPRKHGLFSKNTASPPRVSNDDTESHRSFFGRKRDSRHSMESEHLDQDNRSHRGFFGSTRRSSDSDHADMSRGRTGNSMSNGGGGFFGIGGHNFSHDPTIQSARQKVMNAERAERDADNALMQARNMVREAKEHVEFLEREALEEERRAKAKQAEVKVVRKSANILGRHG